MKETQLYAPVKRYLEARGYCVKGEIGACDVMAVKGDDDPVIIELKTGFSLSLFQQGIDRQKVTDAVYLAVPRGTTRAWRSSLRDNRALCRRLGLGLILIRLKDGRVDVVCDPAPYRPRKMKARKQRLLAEFERIEGDPNTGGSIKGKRMTGYRQDALRVAIDVNCEGPSKGAMVAKRTGVEIATRIMYANHYGWFERNADGFYGLTERGQKDVDAHLRSQ